jgi:hypothetical protein
MYVHRKHCNIIPQNLLKRVSIYPVLPVPGPCNDSLAKNDDDCYAVTDLQPRKGCIPPDSICCTLAVECKYE